MLQLLSRSEVSRRPPLRALLSEHDLQSGGRIRIRHESDQRRRAARPRWTPRSAGRRDYPQSVVSEHSIHHFRVRTPSQMVSLPWESAQDFVARALAAYPTVHPVVDQFRARGVSRPVELLDTNDRTFVLAVIEAWTAQVGEDELPPGIVELSDALRAG
jgi:hypothetical protein